MDQPCATSDIQKNVEQHFFANFAERAGIDAALECTPIEVAGIRHIEQLRIMKAGLFDIISLRLSQVSRDEPTMLGLGLVILNPNHPTGNETVVALPG